MYRCSRKFLQNANDHLSDRGCEDCGLKIGSSKQTLTLEKFLQNCKNKHGDGKYDYSKFYLCTISY